jgi:hypothetical protein
MTWLRWGIVIFLQTGIVALLLLRTGNGESTPSKVVETGSDINGLYQTCELIPHSQCRHHDPIRKSDPF